MHIKAKPPVLVPRKFRGELEKLSKAALMDLVWDFAQMSTPTRDVDDASEPGAIEDDIMGTLRAQAEIVLLHREQN